MLTIEEPAGSSASLSFKRTSLLELPKLDNYKQISTGGVSTGAFTLAIKIDGTLWSWGTGAYGQLGQDTSVVVTTPTQVGSESNWLKVSAGFKTAFGIKSDKSLWIWGEDIRAVIAGSSTTTYYTPARFDSNKYKDISAGYDFAVAIRDDGTLWAWGKGDGYSYRLGTGDTNNYAQPVQIGSDADWRAVACAWEHCIATKSDGSLYGWGSDGGRLCLSTTPTNRTVPTKLRDPSWSHIAVGQNSSYAIEQNGTLLACSSSNTYGELGSSTTAKNLLYDGNWSTVSAGEAHALALKKDGTLWAWGRNHKGQVGTQEDNTSAIRQVGVASNWGVISAGLYQSFAQNSEGEFWAWGANDYYQLGLDYPFDKARPTLLNSTNEWDVIASGGQSTLAIKHDGTLWAWGLNQDGQLGIGNTIAQYTPVQVVEPGPWKSVAVGKHHVLAIKRDGTLWSWGGNGNGELGQGDTVGRTVPTQVGTLASWKKCAAGEVASACLYDSNSTLTMLYTWGKEDANILGRDLNTNANANANVIPATVVNSGLNWTDIAVGKDFMLGMQADGTIYSWGYNTYYQLGTTVAGPVSNPTSSKAALSSAKKMCAGDDFGAYIDVYTDEIYVWGNNSDQRLGTDKNSSLLAVYPLENVASPSKWREVSCGQDSIIAIKLDGTLWYWGRNHDGTNSFETKPTQLDLGSDFVSVASGNEHTLALKADGTLYGFGASLSGELGKAVLYVKRSSPTLIGWRKKLSNGSHTLAIEASGTLWAWGSNSYGQLGVGDYSRRNNPEQVGQSNEWKDISVGAVSSYGIKNDGTLWAWGDNSFGELGTGDTNLRLFPVQVGSATNWKSVSAGTAHVVGLKEDGTLFSWGSNAYGQLGLGTISLVPYKSTPQLVNESALFSEIMGFKNSTYTKKSDGTVWYAGQSLK